MKFKDLNFEKIREGFKVFTEVIEIDKVFTSYDLKELEEDFINSIYAIESRNILNKKKNINNNNGQINIASGNSVINVNQNKD